MSDQGGSEEARIQDLALEHELGRSFGRYAEKVILDRAIPDIRDGLKPVQRRIIYAMYDSGNTADKPYRKSAKTVGDVMGNYHPHGDSAIYDALVRLAQPWKMRYPLVDGHGNFGSMDDDPPAAMRYTEARLSPIAAELLHDIDKDTVAFRPNFDEKTEEPVVLPGGFLNLLLNGTSGVSAGFATDVPSHNLVEVTDACLAMLRRPRITTEGLMKFVQGPDFPTGGVVMGIDGLREAYEGGRGKVVLRARHAVEKLRDGKHLLVFTEIPYNVVKSELVRQLDNLRMDRAVQGVLDVRDETDREGLRVVVELSKMADVDGVLAYLFKKTDLQINYHFNMVTIVRNTPRQVGLREMVEAFVEHRREVVRRRSQHDLDRAETRLHQVEGLVKAVDILDEVIATIRASEDRADARKNLIPLGFTEVQADAILDLRLARLTNLQLLQLTEECAQLTAEIERLREILENPKVCDKVVATELRAIKKAFGDARRTDIVEEVVKLDVSLRATVKEQDVVVGLTHGGWIKRASMASFSAMGGDRQNAGVRPGDRMHDVVVTNTTHTALVFSSSGACFPIPVHQIPETKWGDNGTALVNVCGIDREDSVVGLVTRKVFSPEEFMLFVTADGVVKATALSEFESSRSAGILAMRVKEGDRLACVQVTSMQGDVLLLSRRGQGIRFGLDDVSVQGRSARGVRGMVVGARDEVVDVVQVAPDADPETQIGLFTASGRAKLSPLEQHPRQRRGGKGTRMVISKASRPHTCVGMLAGAIQDKVVLVDTEGEEHGLTFDKIPVTRRDGNTWNVVSLKRGATVAFVEHEVYVPDPEEPAEAEAEAGGDGDGEAEGDSAKAKATKTKG